MIFDRKIAPRVREKVYMMVVRPAVAGGGAGDVRILIVSNEWTRLEMSTSEEQLKLSSLDMLRWSGHVQQRDSGHTGQRSLRMW